ncbi:MAG: PAS domain-containing protein [Bacteroidetes bacterium]|nr:PAS domain-containing protein [Bacteroidota bacterium]
MQSTNEELQSLNEELHTVSAEHQLKIKELVDLNDDMNNYFNTSDIGQVLIDKHLIVRKFSPAITKLINLIDTDINRSITDITTRFQGFDFIQDIKTVIKSNIPLEKEIALSSSWYIMRIHPYLKSDKSSDGVVVSFIDISEPKRLSGILEAVFNSTPSCIIAYQAIRNERNELVDFKCMTANTAAEHEMDAQLGTMAGKRLKVSYPEKSLEHYNLYKEVVETGKINHYEYFNEKKDKWYDTVLIKMQDGLVVIETNISDKKKAADVIAQSYENLKQTSGELQNINLKLEQSNLDLLQFASIASHDLKEPLRKIQTYGNLLMSKVKNKMEDSELNNLNKIINASDRMQKLIEDVLALSKLSNAHIPLEKVDVNAVISRIIDDLEISIKEHNAVINVSALPIIYGIEGQVQQLFQNFISNSLKFTEDKTPIINITDKKLSPEQIKLLGINSAEYFCISIKDNGIGFEEAYKEKIFGIFQRLNGNNYAGTGIGLAICKKIMENHKGFILTESILGDGAEFILGFPKNYMGSLN